MRKYLLPLFFIALACPQIAFAWGPHGHALIAEIATAHLDTQTRHAVSRLLATGGQKRLDKIASWADAIRHKRHYTGPWHYVDIPLQARGYNKQRDCPDGNCVVARIVYFADILGDRSASNVKRLEALKFVVHFVGDAQQPLHAENNYDAGGNQVKLTYFGYHTNLHSLWDSGILERALHLHVGPHYSIQYKKTRKIAKRLDGGITSAERHRWAHKLAATNLKHATIHWVNQAHRLARDVAYGDLPEGSKKQQDKAYQRRAWAVERRQIQRGGVRLAATLNAIFNP